MNAVEGTRERVRKGQREGLDEEDLVFTGCDGGFLRGREGGYYRGEDYGGALGGVDDPVEALSAVVLHHRDGLTVVGIQARAQCCLVVVAAAYERFARYLGGSMTRNLKKRKH